MSAKALRIIRAGTGETQAELARRIGVSRQVVNYYERGKGPGGTNVRGPDPFVNAAGGDFHLKAGSRAINRGADLGAAYAQDPDGNTRGADGAWDIGAFEFQKTRNR